MPRKTSPPSTASLADPPAKGEATRAKLIEAAYGLFLRQGFHGTSMRQIAEEAGLAVGGIYNHFATKEEIFAVVLDAYHPYHALLPALEQTQGDTLEAFVRDAAGRVKTVLDETGLRIMPLAFMELVEFQGRHLRDMARTMLPAMLTFFQRFTERQGQLRAVPLPVVVRTFVILMLGFLITEFILKDLKGLRQFKMEDFNWYDGMIDIYLHGIVAGAEA
jgi:AcrR family transcriptional regulator